MVSELTPPQPEKFHEAGTYCGTIEPQKGHSEVMKTPSRACNKYAFLGSRPRFEVSLRIALILQMEPFLDDSGSLLL